MNLIILGPQGSGKGTQAKLLAQKYNLTHISSGDLLRKEAESGSKKGRVISDLLKTGKLLPIGIVLGLTEESMLKAKTGFILDGTPRNQEQTTRFEEFVQSKNINIDKVILLDIPREESLKRLSKRAEIEHRADDTPQAINKRLSIYQNDTKPVIEHFRSQGKLLVIDGTPDIQTIFLNIVNKLTSE